MLAPLSRTPHPARSVRARWRAGFTLLEVLLALALGSALLYAASAFLFQATDAFITLEEAPRHREHADGVERFLVHLFRRVDLAAASEEDENQPSGKERPITWAALPDDSLGEDNYLSFPLSVDTPFFRTENGPAPPGTQAWLMPDPPHGLFLIWQTPEQRREDPEDFQRTLLTPHLAAFEYLFYQTEENDWEEGLDALEENQDKPLPDQILLTLRWEDEREQSRQILVPPRIKGAPVY